MKWNAAIIIPTHLKPDALAALWMQETTTGFGFGDVKPAGLNKKGCEHKNV